MPLLSEAYFLKDPSDIECKEGEEAIFTFQIRSNSPSVILLKDGKDITENDNCKMSSEGIHHELKLINTKYTDAGEYIVQVGQSYRKVQLNIKELPTIEEKNTYLNALQFGEEERRYVRIQVIGKDRVGKTSLVRRLLGKGIDDVISTDGIDIDKSCQIRTSDGEWIIGEVEEEKVQIEKRIQQAVNMKQEVKDHPSKDHPKETKDKTNMINPSKVHSLLADKKNNRIISADENNENELASEYTKHTSDASNNKENATDTVYLSADIPFKNFENLDERDMEEVEQMPDTFQKQNSETSNKSDLITAAIKEYMDDILFYVKDKKHKMTSEGLVECGIWDFAGQKDYYATHQTFFTQDAIYLLVVDIKDDIEAVQHSKQFDIDLSGEYIDFWLDSIHCFRVDDEDTTAHLCPPVIIVCTGIDKVTEIEAEKKEYENKFLKTFGTQRKSRHKRGMIHFISNTEFHKEDFENLKQHISEIAKEMNYFTNKLPTKWIQLENVLAVLKDLKKQNKSGSCEKLENILELAHEISITKDELICFLNYQHKIGNIIFFADKPGYIILQPQWLVDCFKCIMCDDIKKTCIPEDLYELKYRGILSINLIDNLFSKVPDLRFGEYEPHILDVMEKFDIIVKRDSTKSYYLPCMITRSSTPEDIMKKCHTEKSHCTCTPWLVFEFTFLPIAYYNHILFSYIRKYTVCKVDELPALYAGKAVVFLDETKFARLIICFSRNALSLQVWESKPVGDGIYKKIIEELCDKIEELTGQFHKLHYKIKAKCSNGDPSISAGRIGYTELTSICKDGEYFCEEHQNSHSKDNIENTLLKYALIVSI
ncbi:Hypothetical predicted protein [Mytilus galloprovincialis]|uniref:Roc domain-containing protein n=1 Tax=Mytilus galloprovincialis TaxID=29158 RepID=A0A8B6CT65_MYTGA|nr:Hypothetical predicted protein [Mytilus galloprovincialis]